jgi:hypothetical protein
VCAECVVEHGDLQFVLGFVVREVFEHRLEAGVNAGESFELDAGDAF